VGHYQLEEAWPVLGCEVLAAIVAAVGTIMGSIRRYVTDRLGFTKVLEIPSIWLSHAVSTVGFIRIVALEKVAGSSPVGHPHEVPAKGHNQ
jgi:MFS-type transporter involved in bile tolerance (Atg22 family)